MNPEEDFDAERQALLSVFDEARRKGVKLDVDMLQEGRPSGTLEATLLGRAISRHVRAVTGKAPKLEMCPGLLEIRFYAEQGMPAYAYRPRTTVDLSRAERVRGHRPDGRLRGDLCTSGSNSSKGALRFATERRNAQHIHREHIMDLPNGLSHPGCPWSN